MKTLFERARHGESLGIDIVDIHGHLGRYGFTIPDLSAASLVSSMDRLGIDCDPVQLDALPDALHRRGQRRDPCGHAGFSAANLRLHLGLPRQAESIRRSVMGWLDKGFIGIKFARQQRIALHPSRL
jgi:hypothetical protein